MPQSRHVLRHREGIAYLDEGPSESQAPPLLLFHGMLGDLSNWDETIEALAEAGYRVLAPVLPVYDLPLPETSVGGLAAYTRRFVEMMEPAPPVFVGNSLGGQVALVHALAVPRASISGLILSGSSGIYEERMETDVLRRQSRDFIRERAALTFYDDAHVTDELIEEMHDLINNRPLAVRLIKMARSAKNDTITDRLPELADVPTLLVWGRDDVITPPEVAEEFLQRLPRADLHFIEKCGHAPMIERPEAFNRLVLDFLSRAVQTPSGSSPVASGKAS